MRPSVILYRPVGVPEWKLIEASNCRRFPPRLPEQPIFYPVLTFEYAELIAKSWNSQEMDAGHAGIITKFRVESEFVKRYPVEFAGGHGLQELWIPAGELDQFNDHIVGVIVAIDVVYGQAYNGPGVPVSENASREVSELFILRDELAGDDAAFERWRRRNNTPVD